VNSRWYQSVFPTRLSPVKQSVEEFVTVSQGFRLATSVGGVLTGRGGNIIVIDDPLKPDEAYSETRRKAVNDWYDNTLHTRLNDKKDGCIILIMQRLHEDDLVGHVLGQEEWEVVSFPAIAEQNETHLIETPIGARLFRRDVGDVLHPAREPCETLDRIRATIGEYNFAGQYQQAPAPPGGGIVKLEWFRRYAPNELPEKFDLVLQSWDTANKVSELSDFTVCTTWGIKDRRLYQLNVLRKRMESPDLKRAVHDQAQMFAATVILIEDKASGTQLIQELIRDGLRGVTPYAPEHDKIMRMHAQTATIENGFVYLPREAPWLPEYLHELTTFPGAKYDDQADSTSQALAWLNQAPPEPGMLGFMRREVAAMHHRSGLNVEAIAPMVKATPDEVRAWLEEQNKPNALIERYQKNLVRLRGELNCAKCGADLPFGKTKIEAGGRYYCSTKCAGSAY